MTLEFTRTAHFSVKSELEHRLTVAREQGLVDCKAEIDVNNHSSTRDLVLVLNNLLRIREEGAKPTISVG